MKNDRRYNGGDSEPFWLSGDTGLRRPTSTEDRREASTGLPANRRVDAGNEWRGTRHCGHQNTSSTKTLLFSGQAGISDLLQQAEEQGYVFNLVAKPIHPEKLIDFLRGM